jgi:cytochrome c biogenesis protein ResB
MKLLGSAKLAIGLMIYLGIVSFVGTLMPQGSSKDPRVIAWAAANPQWQGWAQTLGLHAVYTSWYFLVGAALLALCTAVCATRRTRVALARFRAIRRIHAAGESLDGSVDYTIALLGSETADDDVLVRVESALADAGLSSARRGSAVVVSSSAWSVWGSPVFHWALVLIFCTIAAGSLFRAEGLMGVPEAVSVKDEAASYRVLTAGPLHRWSAVNRSFLLNGLRLDYVADGMNRGTSPDVTVLDGTGAVVARQVVYPNNALHLGSLTIHSNAWGLSPTFELLDKNGAVLGASSAILDFPSKPTGSTEPGDMEFTGADGRVALLARVTMPLDRNLTVAQAMASNPKVKLELLTPDGKSIGGRTLTAGEKLALPDGSSLRLSRVGFYARLSVVDDPTIPLLYGAFVVALIGVSFALLARQRIIVIEIAETGTERQLEVYARLWRNAGVGAGQIKEILTFAAAAHDKENLHS